MSRKLSDLEVVEMDEAIRARWFAGEYWFPIVELDVRVTEPVIAVGRDEFEELVGASGVRAALRRMGVDRAFLLVEDPVEPDAVSLELSVSELEFERDWRQRFWTDRPSTWLIYASCEETVTIGGSSLIESLSALFPGFRQQSSKQDPGDRADSELA